jgi:hypothetical protein
MQFFAIRRNGSIVSTSACHLSDGLARSYCVSTITEERGKGLGEHATAEPLRLAAKLGCGVGVLQSSAAGYPVCRNLGFADFGGVPICVRMPGGRRRLRGAGIRRGRGIAMPCREPPQCCRQRGGHR